MFKHPKEAQGFQAAPVKLQSRVLMQIVLGEGEWDVTFYVQQAFITSWGGGKEKSR